MSEPGDRSGSIHQTECGYDIEVCHRCGGDIRVEPWVTYDEDGNLWRVGPYCGPDGDRLALLRKDATNG